MNIKANYICKVTSNVFRKHIYSKLQHTFPLLFSSVHELKYSSADILNWFEGQLLKIHSLGSQRILMQEDNSGLKMIHTSQSKMAQT